MPKSQLNRAEPIQQTGTVGYNSQ